MKSKLKLYLPLILFLSFSSFNYLYPNVMIVENSLKDMLDEERETNNKYTSLAKDVLAQKDSLEANGIDINEGDLALYRLTMESAGVPSNIYHPVLIRFEQKRKTDTTLIKYKNGSTYEEFFNFMENMRTNDHKFRTQVLVYIFGDHFTTYLTKAVRKNLYDIQQSIIEEHGKTALELTEIIKNNYDTQIEATT